MMQKVINSGKRFGQAWTRLWRRIPFRMQGKLLVILPLLAITASAVIALVGNHRRAHIQADIQRHYEMARNLNEVLTLMVNAETGMRGYLLTQRAGFLEPYAAAAKKLPAALAVLRAIAEAEPGDVPRLKTRHLLDEIQVLIDRQMKDLAWQQQHVTATNVFAAEVYAHLALGKRTMDDIRANLDAMQNEEKLLLATREHESAVIRWRDYAAIILALLFGVGARLVARHLKTKGKGRGQKAPK
jgi:CHASE3 domain sensor protein